MRPLHVKECESTEKITISQNSYHCFSADYRHHMDDRVGINPNWRSKRMANINQTPLRIYTRFEEYEKDFREVIEEPKITNKPIIA
jgi:hypothetical protein